MKAGRFVDATPPRLEEAKLVRLFTNIDGDGSGFIEPAEFKTLVRAY